MEGDLSLQKCVPCEDGASPLGAEEVQKYMGRLSPGWEVAPDGKSIGKEFRFDNYGEAVKFVNAVATLAEAENHHPDTHLYYKKVVIDLTTHKIDGLSVNDFILASKIEHNTLSRRGV